MHIFRRAPLGGGPRWDGGPARPTIIPNPGRVAAVGILLEVARAVGAALGDGEACTTRVAAAPRQRSRWGQPAERSDVRAAARVVGVNRVHPIGGLAVARGVVRRVDPVLNQSCHAHHHDAVNVDKGSELGVEDTQVLLLEEVPHCVLLANVCDAQVRPRGSDPSVRAIFPPEPEHHRQVAVCKLAHPHIARAAAAVAVRAAREVNDAATLLAEGVLVHRNHLFREQDGLGGRSRRRHGVTSAAHISHGSMAAASSERERERERGGVHWW